MHKMTTYRFSPVDVYMYSFSGRVCPTCVIQAKNGYMGETVQYIWLTWKREFNLLYKKDINRITRKWQEINWYIVLRVPLIFPLIPIHFKVKHENMILLFKICCISAQNLKIHGRAAHTTAGDSLPVGARWDGGTVCSVQGLTQKMAPARASWYPSGGRRRRWRLPSRAGGVRFRTPEW